MFLGCSWGVQPVLGVFSLLETTPFQVLLKSNVFSEAPRAFEGQFPIVPKCDVIENLFLELLKFSHII